MKTRTVNSTRRTALQLLTMGAVVAAGLATTHTAKAEAPCVDDVIGGVCVTVKAPAPNETRASTPSRAIANASCDQLAGVCEAAPTETAAASALVKTGAPLHASHCDQMAGVCDGVVHSSTRGADTDRRGIRDRIESRKARAEANRAHTERAAYTISTAQE